MKYLLLPVLSILLFTACGPKVYTYTPTDKDLSNYESFAFLPNAEVSTPDIDYNEEKVNTVIINTINKNMKNVGYKLDRDNPDLLVLVNIKTDIETETTTEPVYAHYPYVSVGAPIYSYYGPYYYRGYGSFTQFVGYDTDTYRYKEGTVIIDIIDRETKKTVWKGVTSDAVYSNTTAIVTSLIDEVFNEYPTNKITGQMYND